MACVRHVLTHAALCASVCQPSDACFPFTIVQIGVVSRLHVAVPVFLSMLLQSQLWHARALICL
eukprot:160753-Alexandrium_andersonii.AAC.1